VTDFAVGEEDDWVDDGSVCSIHSSMCTTASWSDCGSIVGDLDVVHDDGVEMVFMLTGEESTVDLKLFNQSLHPTHVQRHFRCSH
jgi:hypothetical protein